MIKRWSVPAVPFLVSILLSAVTVGAHPYWQDSGLYLTAIKELGVLYPPGFPLYELLAWLWTKLLFFADFTLAVHLFSSLCAAAAAGAIAVAARDLLRSRGRIFRVAEEDPGDLADACGLLAGVFLACGFTFASAAIYAKGYAFYYLILALLLGAMIRADQSGKPRDFAIAALLIGLAWQAHPSATLLGAALLLFVAVHARSLGWKTVAGGAGIAAAAALGPTLILLPWFVSRDPWMMMGTPTGLGGTLAYLLGKRFFQVPDVFGFDAVRAASFGRYLWEEFLGLGLLLAVVGIGALVRGRRLLPWGILAWTIPSATVTVLFKIEGQHDCWFVGSWLPLYLALAVGALQAARWAGQHARPILLAAGVAGAAWATLANLPDLTQRDYVYAEMYGRTLIENVDPNAVLVLQGDDANGLAGYLQRVHDVRKDVLLVGANYLGTGSYDERLLRRHPTLRAPDYAPLQPVASRYRQVTVAAAAFLNANAGAGRSLFCEQFVPLELLRPGFTLVPAGAVWKLIPQGTAAELDIRYWKFPIEPEEVVRKKRRARGQAVKSTPTRFEVKPERYEDRLINLIVMARYHLAMGLTERGQFLPAARLCESILALDPSFRDRPEIVHHFAISMYAAGEMSKAEPALRRSADISVLPRNRATANTYLAEIARRKGDEAEAQRRYAQALAVPGLDDATRREIERRIGPPK